MEETTHFANDTLKSMNNSRATTESVLTSFANKIAAS
jgi:hypothetical protein